MQRKLVQITKLGRTSTQKLAWFSQSRPEWASETGYTDQAPISFKQFLDQNFPLQSKIAEIPVNEQSHHSSGSFYKLNELRKDDQISEPDYGNLNAEHKSHKQGHQLPRTPFGDSKDIEHDLHSDINTLRAMDTKLSTSPPAKSSPSNVNQFSSEAKQHTSGNNGHQEPVYGNDNFRRIAQKGEQSQKESTQITQGNNQPTPSEQFERHNPDQDLFLNDNPAKQKPSDSLLEQKSKIGQGSSVTGITDSVNLGPQYSTQNNLKDPSQNTNFGNSPQQNQIKAEPISEAIKNVQDAVKMVTERDKISRIAEGEPFSQSRPERKAKGSQGQTNGSQAKGQSRGQNNGKNASSNQAGLSGSKGNKRNSNQNGKSQSI
jgi:hypothetical protein